MKRILGLYLLLLTLTACATGLPDKGEMDPLYYDPKAVAKADKIVIVMPGAVTTAAIFAPVLEWEKRGYAVVFYRLPGLDGLPLDHRFDLEYASSHIAAFADAHMGKSIRLIGYSMGGATMLLASDKIKNPDMKVVAIAPAAERAGGLTTRINGATDMALAALRARSLSKDAIWQEYFEILLHGRRAEVRREKKPLIDRFMDENREELEAPETLITRAHTEDLRGWVVRPPRKLLRAKTGVFVGLEDPIFSTAQTLNLMKKFDLTKLYAYPGDGHLLLITQPRLFDQILAFFEDRLGERPIPMRR